MWIRKYIEINDLDIVWGLLHCCLPGDRELIVRRIQQCWRTDDLLACLSVRSGLDLLLHSSGWPSGSEVIMSGLTIPDMPRIVEKHKMIPIGVDLDPQTLTPHPNDIEALITPRTRAIMIAHLFGGWCDLDAIAEIARRHQLMLIEDCAQAYAGNHQTGDPRAAVSMFSFGPIKTNTALAGAVLCVRDAQLLNRLNANHALWARQTRWTFARRLLKYWWIHKLSSRLGMSGIRAVLRWTGKDHDQFVAHAARGFAGGDFFTRIRRRPPAPLLKTMLRKFQDFELSLVADRQRRALGFLTRLGPTAAVPGRQLNRHTYWVLPILVEQPAPLVELLWKHGFDATHRCSLQVVGARSLPQCQRILDHIVYLPFDARIPDRELERMADLIIQSGAQPPAWWQAYRAEAKLAPK
ncbi:MAG TPA: DegT/DnrJ/EryC1/StrS family aminotransferase, partial [Pirellulaceae bacterium]|nr:DegT/DnrJ/EryC1/StrS family aminotransferase [Pirellulaceae bacterium]